MKRLVTLMMCAVSLGAAAQITYPYNPDGNADGDIAVGDLQDFLVTYGNPFSPSEIMVGDETLTNWFLGIQAVLDSLGLTNYPTSSISYTDFVFEELQSNGCYSPVLISLDAPPITRMIGVDDAKMFYLSEHSLISVDTTGQFSIVAEEIFGEFTQSVFEIWGWQGDYPLGLPSFLGVSEGRVLGFGKWDGAACCSQTDDVWIYHIEADSVEHYITNNEITISRNYSPNGDDYVTSEHTRFDWPWIGSRGGNGTSLCINVLDGTEVTNSSSFYRDHMIGDYMVDEQGLWDLQNNVTTVFQEPATVYTTDGNRLLTYTQENNFSGEILTRSLPSLDTIMIVDVAASNGHLQLLQTPIAEGFYLANGQYVLGQESILSISVEKGFLNLTDIFECSEDCYPEQDLYRSGNWRAGRIGLSANKLQLLGLQDAYFVRQRAE